MPLCPAIDGVDQQILFHLFIHTLTHNFLRTSTETSFHFYFFDETPPPQALLKRTFTLPLYNAAKASQPQHIIKQQRNDPQGGFKSSFPGSSSPPLYDFYDVAPIAASYRDNSLYSKYTRLQGGWILI